MVRHQEALRIQPPVPPVTCVCLWLILLVTLGDQRSLLGAVVVISNPTESTVEVNVEKPEGQPANYQIPGHGLVPIVSFAPVTVRVSLGQLSTTQELSLNRIYEIRTSGDDIDGRVVIAPVQVGNVRPGVWLFPNQEKLPQSVTIPVAIFVDEEQPAKQSVWEPRLRNQVAEASRFLEWFCRVRFEVVSCGTWQSDNGRTGAEEILDDFRQKVPPQKARLLIGFSSQLIVPAESRFHIIPQLLDSHIVIPDLQTTFSAQDQLMSLIHALGHFLGAVDTSEASSVMNPEYVAIGAGRRQRDYFDPLNVLIMNIVAEDLLFRGVGQIDQFSSGTRDYLSALYRSLGQRTRRRDIRVLLDTLERPPVPVERFIVQWQQGRQTSAAEISNWGDPDAQPEISGHLIFDAKDPARWIFDTSLQDQMTLPDAWIEFGAGDRLPGRVQRAIAAGVIEKEYLPAHLEVVPYTRVDWPDGPSRQAIRVIASQVKRIVWQPVVQELRPGQAFLRDGRSLSYRLAQWTSDGVRLLTNDGIQTLTFADLAELHLPVTDPWEEILSQRAGLTPEGKGTIMQLETTDGLIVTTSSERFLARSRGDKNLPENWYHFVQPVWSLDGLWIPHRSVIWRRFFATQEVPLSVLSPMVYREVSTLGGKWGYHVNRNLKDDVMITESRVFGWGFGVPSGSEMVFSLSPLASAFRTNIGLDKLADDGGCIRAVVTVVDKAEHAIYESPLLVGSAQLCDTGPLQLPAEGQGGQLILRVDEAHENRPPAADPWNVRDLANWGEPLLTLDQTMFTNVLQQKKSQLIWAWQGWQVLDDHTPVRIVQALNQSSANYPTFRWVQEFDTQFAIEQTLTIPDQVKTLAVLVSRPRGVPHYRVEIFANDQSLASGDVPERGGWNLPPPIEADLSQFVNQKTRLRVLLRSENATKGLKADWHSIQFVKGTGSNP